jgi:uncharacterized protein (TIGR02266 family)
VRFEVKLEDKADWIKVFDPRDCALFVTASEPPAIATQVRVDLLIGAGGPHVIFRGKVIARRAETDQPRPAGFYVALGPEEHEKINYLNGFVRGGLLNLRERRRLPLRLPVTYGAASGGFKTFTRDINEEGVFVVSEMPLPEDSEIRLRLVLPGRPDELALAGVVSHTVVVEDEDVPGMGIRFHFASDAERQQFSALIDRLEEAFQTGALPEDVLL